MAAYRWLLRSKVPPHAIVMAGDSAGGQLTITTLLALRDASDPLPAAAVAIAHIGNFARRHVKHSLAAPNNPAA